MSSSYFESLGRKIDEPEDISKTNYLSEEVDMTKSINENIDKTHEMTKMSYQSLVASYNHMNEAAQNRPEALIKLTKTGIQTHADLKKFQKFHQKVNKYQSGILPDLAEGAIRGGDKWKFAQINSSDKDIQTENGVELNRDIVKSELTTAAAAELRVNENVSDAADYLQGGDGQGGPQVYREDLETDLSMEEAKNNYQHIFRGEAEAGMQVDLHQGGEWGFDVDELLRLNGGQRYATYQNSTGKLRDYVDQVIDSWWFFQHQDIAGGRIGRWKRDFLLPIMKLAETRKLEALKADGTAAITVQEKRMYEELTTNLGKKPNYFSRWINTYRGYYNGSAAAAREQATQWIIKGIQSGHLKEDDVRFMLSEKFKAYDGTIVSAEEYWKPEAARIKKALRVENTKEMTALEDEAEAKLNTGATELANKWNARKTIGSIEELNTMRAQLAAANGIDPEQLPDIVKNLPYAGMGTDFETDLILQKRRNNLEKLTIADLKGIEDPDLLEKWLERVDKGGLNAAESKQIDRYIKGEVNHKTNQDVGHDDVGDREWIYHYESAKQAFNNGYLQAIEYGASQGEAVQEGRNAVNAILGTEAFELRKGIPGHNIESVNNVKEINEAILNDRSFINSPTPWKGEEAALKEAIQYIQGKQVNIPQFYRSFGGIQKLPNGKPASPYNLMLYRLEANGLLKQGEVVIPEENLPNSAQQQLLVKPSPSKTYRVMQENDVNFVLEQVQDPVSAGANGYDTIVNENGEVAQLEVPLTQLSVGEVLALANQGYNTIGMYGITGRGLKDIIQSANVPLDILFDKDAQDLLILARLRQKANKAQEYSTIDERYRRLVNIDAKDREEFLNIVGQDLPAYLRLENLLPAVAEELVKQTLQ